MSASLVGSEMCIRDSVPTGPPSSMSDDKIAALEAKLADAVKRIAELEACLLYTSDAADDM
eukprot:4278084-Alexandrium_andersonii.AAC.1